MSAESLESGPLELVHDPSPGTRSGCNAVILRLVAAPLLLGGSLGLWLSLGDRSLGLSTILSLFVVLFGLVCWMGAGNQKRMDFRFQIQIDPQARVLRFFKDRADQAHVVPFADLVALRARRVTEADTDESTAEFAEALDL